MALYLLHWLELSVIRQLERAETFAHEGAIRVMRDLDKHSQHAGI